MASTDIQLNFDLVILRKKLNIPGFQKCKKNFGSGLFSGIKRGDLTLLWDTRNFFRVYMIYISIERARRADSESLSIVKLCYIYMTRKKSKKPVFWGKSEKTETSGQI